MIIALEWNIILIQTIKHKINPIFIIGGSRVYREALNHKDCKSLYITYINNNYKCDTFFPEIPDHFISIYRSANYCENNLTYNFKIFKNSNFSRIDQALLMDYKEAISQADHELNKYNSNLWKSRVTIKEEPVKKSWAVSDKGEHKTSWAVNKKL